MISSFGETGDAELVEAARAGESDAFGQLVERWFDRCYDVALGVVRDPEGAADVTQDTLIKAWERLDQLDDGMAFGGWLLRITRNTALDRLRRESRSRPVETAVLTGMHDQGAPEPDGTRRAADEGDPARVVTDAERDEILTAAAVALGESDASLLGLHLRHGLTPAEIAEELGISPNVAHRRLFRMRERLGTAIGALSLWQHGRPECPVLADLVEGQSGFDSDVATAVEQHRQECDDCSRRRAALVAPHHLFSALPVAVIPFALRQRVVEGLAAAGVPTAGLGPGPGSGSGTGSGGSGGATTAAANPAATGTAAGGAGGSAAGTSGAAAGGAGAASSVTGFGALGGVTTGLVLGVIGGLVALTAVAWMVVGNDAGGNSDASVTSAGATTEVTSAEVINADDGLPPTTDSGRSSPAPVPPSSTTTTTEAPVVVAVPPPAFSPTPAAATTSPTSAPPSTAAATVLGPPTATTTVSPTSTDPPVTDPPVTDPPVTDPPVTDPPVTDPPVTDPPVTDPPVTDPPVTDPPVTDPPVTDPPVTDPPVTDPPVTDPPVTDPPVTDPPVTDPPVTDPPVTDPPVTDPPVTDPPVTDPPVTDPPVTDPPVTDPPVTDPPVTDPPVTDPPATAPLIVFFGALPDTGQVCEQPDASGWLVAWVSLRADSGQLTVGGASSAVRPIGAVSVCALPGTIASLRVEGEDGFDSATIVLG